MSTKHAVEFAELLDALRAEENQYGRSKLAIWGGECDEAHVSALLAAFNAPNGTMNYCVWETPRKIMFVENKPPESITRLEQARVFGARGDLALRREGKHFLWRFVGESETRPAHLVMQEADGIQAAIYFDDPLNDFWASEPNDAVFVRAQESALLWGERNSGETRWYEDRVGNARLEYPVEMENEKQTRVRLHYWTFSRAGRVEFAWFRELEAVQEDSNG